MPDTVRQFTYCETCCIALGFILALLIQRLSSSRLRILALVTGSVAIGAVASFFSSELFVSWRFLVIEPALALLSASVTMVLVAGWERSRTLRWQQAQLPKTDPHAQLPQYERVKP